MMITVVAPEHIVITPRPPRDDDREGIIPPETATCPTRHGDVVVVWASDGVLFRMDVNLPMTIIVDVILPLRANTVYVNGEIVWRNNIFQQNRSGVYAGEVSANATRLRCGERQAFHIAATRDAA